MTTAALPADFTTCYKMADGRLAGRSFRNGVWGYSLAKPHTKITSRTPWVTEAEFATMARA